MPLTQPQFAEFYGAYKSSDIDLIRFKSLLPGTSLFSDPKGYYEELSANIYPLSEFKPYKAKIMNEYLLCGGYPGYFSSASTVEWQASLLKIIDHTLYFDIAAAYNIKSPQKLKKLLYLIAAKGDHEQSYGSIGRALYVDTSTIIGYISFLHDSGFASAAENYSLNSNKNGRVIRKNKRFYIFDTGICNSLLRNTDTAVNYGGFVTQSCRYMACEYAIDAGGEIFFWKDGNREVDIVVSVGNTLLPISVNYQADFSDRCAKFLKVFMRLHGAKNAVIITKDILKSEDGIFYIPYWMI